jgi:hypothetical protein
VVRPVQMDGRGTCGETVRVFWVPAVKPYGFTLSRASTWEPWGFQGAWRSLRRTIASAANTAIHSSCGFAKKKFMGKETGVILSAPAYLSAHSRGVLPQVRARTCGNTGR